MASIPKIPTVIVDKNGKRTTVYKKAPTANALPVPKNFAPVAPTLSDADQINDIFINTIGVKAQPEYIERYIGAITAQPEWYGQNFRYGFEMMSGFGGVERWDAIFATQEVFKSFGREDEIRAWKKSAPKGDLDALITDTNKSDVW